MKLKNSSISDYPTIGIYIKESSDEIQLFYINNWRDKLVMVLFLFAPVILFITSCFITINFEFLMFCYACSILMFVLGFKGYRSYMIPAFCLRERHFLIQNIFGKLKLFLEKDKIHFSIIEKEEEGGIEFSNIQRRFYFKVSDQFNTKSKICFVSSIDFHEENATEARKELEGIKRRLHDFCYGN